MTAFRSRWNPSTHEFERRLYETPDVKQFLEENRDGLITPRLCYYLAELCRQREVTPSEVVLRADMDKSYGYQLFNGTRKPSRDKLLQLAFGLGLSVEETQDLLKIAGKSLLYPKFMRDAAIMHCLHEGKQIDFMQQVLGELGLTRLGGTERHD